MKVGSLFTGIGGFDLGFERAGHEIAWQCEIDPHCRAVLEKHWPGIRRVSDVALVGTHHPFSMCPPECEEGCALEEKESCIGISELADELAIDILVGGFPCQDISNASTAHPGGLTGLEGKRSGLWREFARVVRVASPRFVVVENVGALATRGLGEVLGDLADCGYDAEWAVLPASALGAAHLRKRLFIVAWRPDLLSDSDRAGLERHVGGILAQPGEGGPNPHSPGPTGGRANPRVRRGADGLPRGLDGRAVVFRTGETAPRRKQRLMEIGNAVDVRVAEFIGRSLA